MAFGSTKTWNLNSDTEQLWNPTYKPAHQQTPTYGSDSLLNTTCSLTQLGSPSSDPTQSCSIVCGPTWSGNLKSHLSKCGAQSLAPHNYGVKLEVIPNHRAWPASMPNSRAQPMANPISKPSLLPLQLQGTACDTFDHRIRTWGAAQQWRLTCGHTWTSQLHHPLGEHSLRPHLTRKKLQITLCKSAQWQYSTSGPALPGNTACYPF